MRSESARPDEDPGTVDLVAEVGGRAIRVPMESVTAVCELGAITPLPWPCPPALGLVGPCADAGLDRSAVRQHNTGPRDTGPGGPRPMSARRGGSGSRSPLLLVDLSRLLGGSPGEGRYRIDVRWPAGAVALRVDRICGLTAGTESTGAVAAASAHTGAIRLLPTLLPWLARPSTMTSGPETFVRPHDPEADPDRCALLMVESDGRRFGLLLEGIVEVAVRDGAGITGDPALRARLVRIKGRLLPAVRLSERLGGSAQDGVFSGPPGPPLCLSGDPPAPQPPERYAVIVDAAVPTALLVGQVIAVRCLDLRCLVPIGDGRLAAVTDESEVVEVLEVPALIDRRRETLLAALLASLPAWAGDRADQGEDVSGGGLVGLRLRLRTRSERGDKTQGSEAAIGLVIPAALVDRVLDPDESHPGPADAGPETGARTPTRIALKAWHSHRHARLLTADEVSAEMAGVRDPWRASPLLPPELAPLIDAVRRDEDGVHWLYRLAGGDAGGGDPGPLPWPTRRLLAATGRLTKRFPAILTPAPVSPAQKESRHIEPV